MRKRLLGDYSSRCDHKDRNEESKAQYMKNQSYMDRCQTFKDDINTDSRIYPECKNVVTEKRVQQQPTGGKETN